MPWPSRVGGQLRVSSLSRSLSPSSKRAGVAPGGGRRVLGPQAGIDPVGADENVADGAPVCVGEKWATRRPSAASSAVEGLAVVDVAAEPVEKDAPQRVTVDGVEPLGRVRVCRGT